MKRGLFSEKVSVTFEGPATNDFEFVQFPPPFQVKEATEQLEKKWTFGRYARNRINAARESWFVATPTPTNRSFATLSQQQRPV